jgi:hypothetical protein
MVISKCKKNRFNWDPNTVKNIAVIDLGKNNKDFQ